MKRIAELAALARPVLAESMTLQNEFDGLIVRLWRQGFDTWSIARYARIDESKVANRLAKLRDEGAL